LTSKNASKKNSPQAAKEAAHVNAISYQSFLWVFVNEFMSRIVSTNAEGRLLESAEERIFCAVILRCLKKDDQESVQQKLLE
jgi:hypothetical protein